MRAGYLRNKAEIQLLGDVQDEFGSVVEDQYTKFKDVWCSIIPISGKENFLSNTDFAKTTHKIKIRYLENINASMRLVWKNRVFNFTSVRNISERDKEIEILAEEVING